MYGTRSPWLATGPSGFKHVLRAQHSTSSGFQNNKKPEPSRSPKSQNKNNRKLQNHNNTTQDQHHNIEYRQKEQTKHNTLTPKTWKTEQNYKSTTLRMKQKKKQQIYSKKSESWPRTVFGAPYAYGRRYDRHRKWS